jgi:hypothetical protein
MLIKLGFERDFVDLLMTCVQSVKYKVRYNDQETEGFIPSRGLRQGILFHLIYSLSVQKDYLLLWLMKRRFVALKVFGCAEMHRQFPIYYLLMIP